MGCNFLKNKKKFLIPKKLYDRDANLWLRDKPSCLSDFTARKHLIKDLSKHKNKKFADLGCGEGYLARKLIKAGGAKVVGIDISKKMINLAKKKQNKKTTFFRGNIIKTRLKSKSFDISYSTFVFNYLKKKQILLALKEMRRITKKNGIIVFTVPHPFLSFIKKKNKNFYFKMGKKFNYFSAKNHKFLGKISKIDGIKLNIQMIHHTFEDYFQLIKNAKINSIEEITELTVNNNLKKNSKSLYNSLKGLPLHLYFKLRNI